MIATHKIEVNINEQPGDDHHTRLFKSTTGQNPLIFQTGLAGKGSLAFIDEVTKLGDFVQVRGLVNFYFINHPELIKLVLKGKAKNLNRESVVHNRIRNVSRTGLITSGGEYWKKQRRTMVPLFTPKNVKSLVSKMSDIVAQRFDQWDKYCDSGETFNMSDEMDRLTLEINCASQFSTSLKKDFDVLQGYFDYINNTLPKYPTRSSPNHGFRASQI